MASRVQNLNIGLGKDSQADIDTASTTFMRVLKLNEDVTSESFNTESNAAEIGKGMEFATETFTVSKTPSGRIEKYGTAEFTIWSFAYAMGTVGEATGLYTITPLVNATTLELPYFSIVEQLPEGGATAQDITYVGCSVEETQLVVTSGPGRQSVKVNTSWDGSGNTTTPSGVSLPAVTVEHSMLGASAALTVSGVDYVGAKTLLGATVGWKNNILLNAGFFPGSGTQDTFAVRGRQEIGVRQCSFDFTVRWTHDSLEYTKLKALTSGSAVLTLTYDATHTVTFTFPQVVFASVTPVTVDGIEGLKVVCDVQSSDGTEDVLTVTGKCGISGIAQPAS